MAVKSFVCKNYLDLNFCFNNKTKNIKQSTTTTIIKMYENVLGISGKHNKKNVINNKFLYFILIEKM